MHSMKIKASQIIQISHFRPNLTNLGVKIMSKMTICMNLTSFEFRVLDL